MRIGWKLTVAIFAVIIIASTFYIGFNVPTSIDSNTYIIDNVQHIPNLIATYETLEIQLLEALEKPGCKIGLHSIALKDKNIVVKGYVEINTEKLFFDLEGELLRNSVSSHRLVMADLVDKKNHFEVVHFSIDDSQVVMPATGKRLEETTLNMHLRIKDTRDYIFLMIPLPEELIDKKNIFALQKDLEIAGPSELFWFQKIILDASE